MIEMNAELFHFRLTTQSHTLYIFLVGIYVLNKMAQTNQDGQQKIRPSYIRSVFLRKKLLFEVNGRVHNTNVYTTYFYKYNGYVIDSKLFSFPLYFFIMVWKKYVVMYLKVLSSKWQSQVDIDRFYIHSDVVVRTRTQIIRGVISWNILVVPI